jgi:biopolymer transport protein TolR
MPSPLPRRGGMFAEINMIPLIDIALILLIIMMVITPMLVQSQLSVKLPKAKQGEAAQQGEAVEVMIDKTGKVAVNGRIVRIEDLERELTLLLPRSGEKTVLVQADRGVPIQSVVEVLDVGKKLGVGKLGIGVLQQQN